MKPKQLSRLLVLALALTLTATACKKTPVNTIDMRGRGPNALGTGEENSMTNLPAGPPINPQESAASQASKDGIPLVGPGQFANWPQDREALKTYAVYFDFDSSVIKSGERPKLNGVAEYIKAHSGDALRIEGNCDERGTEEYNRALGERRALACREALVELGLDAGHVETLSNGKDKPVAPGHDEAAWRLNRRCDFIVLTPPATAQ